MTNLTLLELAAIAVVLDEEGAERKREKMGCTRNMV